MVEKSLSYYSSHKFDMKIDLYKTKYNSISFYKSHSINKMYDTDINLILPQIRNAVINSVKRRLHADRPIAFLLSGGVDSSLVAAISTKLLGENNIIRTFCCGIKGSTDMIYAKKVADHIGSNHTEVYFTEEEGLAAIKDVIRTTETWDITTIRASVGQYLVSKYISEHTDCKVVLVGEGPDEVCSSYIFNWYAPSGKELD
jgi:asparagine synthase (glutamine-hydrolysing)